MSWRRAVGSSGLKAEDVRTQRVARRYFSGEKISLVAQDAGS